MTKRKNIIYNKRSSVLIRVDPQFKDFMDDYRMFLQGRLGVDFVTNRKASLNLYRAIKIGKNPFDNDLYYF